MTRKRKSRSRRSSGNRVRSITRIGKARTPDDADPLALTEPPIAAGPAAAVDDLADETADTGTYAAPGIVAEDMPEGGVALNSLQRLEVDIRELHTRWAAVERELASRDMQIAQLEEEQAIQLDTLETMQAELDDGRMREAELQAELQSRQNSLEGIQADMAERAGQLAARDQLVAASESRLEALQAELDRSRESEQTLQGQLDSQREEYLRAEEKISAQKAIITELKITRTDLEAYIDRRKAQWERQNADLEEYRDALSGMEVSLRDKGAEIGREKKEKNELGAEILRLQSRCDELAGRRAEREATNRELQDRLYQLAAEIETLRQAAQAAEGASAPLQGQLDEYAAQLDAARADNAQLRSELEALRRDGELSEEQVRASADREISSMRVALETAVAERDDRQSKLDDLRVRLEQLDAEFSEYRNRTAMELAASMQRGAQLEQELESRAATLRALDRNIDMVNQINASVQRLDQQISASASAAGDTDRSSGIRRLMVAQQGQKQVRYPLYKNCMTIGRSPDADIQVRHKWISRQHARIVVDDDTVTIEDLGSKNGILINNKAVRAGELHNEDVVDIGDTRFQFIDLLARPGEHVA